MRTWLDLEERFQSLGPALRFVRLDFQWGAAGEHWRLAGTGAVSSVAREFKILCAIGGRFLEQSLDRDSELGMELFAEADPEIRWYRLLKHSGNGVASERFAWQTDDAGNHMGNIYSATIQEIGAVCSNQCLELHARYPIREPRKPWYKSFYSEYGKDQVRVVLTIVVTALVTLAITWVVSRFVGPRLP